VDGNEQPDSELLTRLRNEPELIGTLYDRHARAVLLYLARRAGPAAAEDLLSEVFVAALAARKRVVAHDSGSALPWLYGIASNVLRRHLRHGKTHGVGWRQDVAVDWGEIDARIDAQAQRKQLRAALGILSPSERELLLLVAWEGLTPTEAAQALGISKGAARIRLHRARQRALHALLLTQSRDLDLISTLLTHEENPTRTRSMTSSPIQSTSMGSPQPPSRGAEQSLTTPSGHFTSPVPTLALQATHDDGSSLSAPPLELQQLWRQSS
jgi:RNA polymerase sigma factor (sigma-70 family)